MSSVAWILIVLAFIFLLVICIVRVIWKRNARRQFQQIEARFEEIVQRRQVRNRAWKRRVGEAQHLLTGKDWRDPKGKIDFVDRLYGGVPECLWYALGDTDGTINLLEEIYKIFYPTKNRAFGDIEVLPSENPLVGIALRIRNPQRFEAEIEVNGQKCPLYQTGFSQFGDDDEGCASLLDLYNEPQAVASLTK